MKEPFHPPVDSEEFGQMMNISAKLAGMYIAVHPKRIKIGKGKIRQTFRLPYETALALATGREELPALDKPRKSSKTPAMPRTVHPSKATKNAPRAANGCLYGVPRRTKEA